MAERAWPIVLAIALPLLGWVLLGQDSNWDLRNYHLYNPHAWLTGRMALDVAPAQLQSWHNPLLDVPLYLLVRAGGAARWAGLWLTLPTMVALYGLLRLQAMLSSAAPTRIAQLALALIAITGAATFSTLGSSMDDSFVAAAMLSALALLLPAGADASPLRPVLLAGVLAGAMAGLKLTASFYCLGLACALPLLVAGSPGRKLRALGALAAGGLLGFLLTYGYWGWLMYASHGNPVFPYFNDLFQSPDALARDYADPRFRPASLPQALLSPLRLLRRSQEFSELWLRDPRLLLGLLGLGALLGLAWRRPVGEPLRRRQLAALWAFFLVSWLLWIGQYGIYRYAIVLELLGSLALVLLLQRLPRGAGIAVLLAVLLVNADTKRPNWGHDASQAAGAGIQAAPVPDDGLLVIASGEPLAYLALGLPDRVPLVAVANNLMAPGQCTRLQARAERLLAGHRGPVWLLTAIGASASSAQSVLTSHYGLQAAAACVPWANGLAPAQLCPQRRIRAATVPTCPRPGSQ